MTQAISRYDGRLLASGGTAISPAAHSGQSLQRPLERPDDGHRAHVFHHQARRDTA
jgi:hypothetical protein